MTLRARWSSPCCALWRVAPDPSPQLRPAPRVEHILPLRPAAPRHFNPVAYIGKMCRRMSVGINDDAGADLNCASHVAINQVKPLRKRVDLERCAGAGRGLEDSFEVHRIWSP